MRRLVGGDDALLLRLDAEGDAIVDDVGDRARLLGDELRERLAGILVVGRHGDAGLLLDRLELRSPSPPIPAGSCSRSRSAPPLPTDQRARRARGAPKPVTASSVPPSCRCAPGTLAPLGDRSMICETRSTRHCHTRRVWHWPWVGRMVSPLRPWGGAPQRAGVGRRSHGADLGERHAAARRREDATGPDRRRPGCGLWRYRHLAALHGEAVLRQRERLSRRDRSTAFSRSSPGRSSSSSRSNTSSSSCAPTTAAKAAFSR